MIKNNSSSFKSNHTHDAGWPYHYNERKHMMVPCATNPCRYHSNGNDFDMSSYDDANLMLNTMLSESGISDTDNLSKDDVNIMLNKYMNNMSKNVVNDDNDNYNDIDDKNQNKDNSESLRNGSYYIYCSPVNDNDTDEVAARKIQQFCDYMGMFGIFKIADAALIRGGFTRKGVVLSFHVSNDNEYNRILGNNGVLQKIANDYDNGTGLLVFNKNPSVQSQNSINIVHSNAEDIVKTLKDNGYDTNNLYGYEYKNKNNKPRTLIANINGDKDKLIPFLKTQKYVMSSRNCNIKLFIGDK